MSILKLRQCVSQNILTSDNGHDYQLKNLFDCTMGSQKVVTIPVHWHTWGEDMHLPIFSPQTGLATMILIWNGSLSTKPFWALVLVIYHAFKNTSRLCLCPHPLFTQEYNILTFNLCGHGFFIKIHRYCSWITFLWRNYHCCLFCHCILLQKYLYIVEIILSTFCIGSLEHAEPMYNCLWPTIICIHSKTENVFSEKKSFYFHCVWASVTLFL